MMKMVVPKISSYCHRGEEEKPKVPNHTEKNPKKKPEPSSISPKQ